MTTTDLFEGEGPEGPATFDPERWRAEAFGVTTLPGLAEQIKAVERELGYRRLAYPKWIRENRISYGEAVRQVCAMRAVLVTLKRVRFMGDGRREP